MGKSIAVIGTLDTKGEEIRYCSELIEKRGHKAVVIDVSVMGEPPFKAAISKWEVMKAAGVHLDGLIALQSEKDAMAKMSEGAAKIVHELYTNDKLDGAMAFGGTMGTSMGLTVMKVLPLGVPKLILSTIAVSPLIPVEATTGDLMMMQWAAGLQGLNSINRSILDAAAGAITGAAELFNKRNLIKKRPIVGISSLGPHKYKYLLRPPLEQRGYEVATFHAVGGGIALERAIEEGRVDVVLDLALIEVSNEICGGMASAGKCRLDAAGKMGIPQIVSPMVDAVHWAATKPIPRKFRGRFQHRHNWLTTSTPTNKEEKVKAGKWIARKLNRAKGPTAIIIPMKIKPPSLPGMEGIGDPEGMAALIQTVKDNVKSHVRVVEIDAAMDDPLFLNKLLELFDEITRK